MNEKDRNRLSTDVAVIGAGPAGLAAALELAKLGLDVALIDRYPTLGGQYFVQGAQNENNEELQNLYDSPLRLSEIKGMLQEQRVKVFSHTTVWGVYEGQELALEGENAPARLFARRIILATGARERFIPFRGWNLSGVLSLAGTHRMLKSQHIAPAGDILIAGSGPLTLELGASLVKSGANVTCILEASQFWRRGIQHVYEFLPYRSRIIEAISYLHYLRKQGISYRPGWVLTAAEGEGKVQRARIAKINQNGEVLSQTETVLPVDVICTGFGFVPNSELARYLGCEMLYQSSLGGYVPVVDDWMSTTVPAVYSAGECNGIRGAEAAFLEGRIAGIAAASSLGVNNETRSIGCDMPHIYRKLDKWNRFGRALSKLYLTRLPSLTWMSEDTTLCRCEHVTLHDIKSEIQKGATEMRELKQLTRVGMGRCQGRTCGWAIRQVLSLVRGISPEEVGSFSIRPPLYPVRLEELSNGLNNGEKKGDGFKHQIHIEEYTPFPE